MVAGVPAKDDEAVGAGDEALWAVLEPLREERERIERILARLAVAEDLVERADLASELVRSASRYEDTLERAVEPAMDGSDRPVPVGDREPLRDAMTVIHERTMHVDPRNVHAPDPQGFEDTLEEVTVRLSAQLAVEDGQIGGFAAGLSPDDREQLAGEVGSALRNASERPRPPRTAIGRAIGNAHVKLDHNLEDVAAPQHPGAATVEG